MDRSAGMFVEEKNVGLGIALKISKSFAKNVEKPFFFINP